MSITALPEPETSAPPQDFLLEGSDGQMPGGSRIGRFVGKLGRRLQALWVSRVVEGVLLKRQFEKFYLIMGGHIYFQTLSAAVEFDLFGILSKHKRLTRSEIARILDIDEKPARILLLGCTSLGLLRKSGATYSNSRLAERLLVRDAPANIISVIRWQNHINYRPMQRFFEAIKSNTNLGLDEFEGKEDTLYGRLTHDPTLERIFQDAMQSISVQANKMLAKFVDFSDTRHLVDVGGGNGSNIITLARAHSHLKATVFDSASVCEIARDNIRSAGLANRLDAVAGDCFTNDFPVGADCFLFSHFFTIWSKQQNLTLLQKCYQSLPSGGKVIVFNMMQNDDETGPLSAALGSPYFLTLATGKGMLYTWSDYVSWMKEAGFTNVTKQTLPRDHGVVVGTKP